VNPYRNGFTDFYDTTGKVSSQKPLTVTTQFLELGGELAEVRRTYHQDGKTFELPPVAMSGGKLVNSSLTDEYCEAEEGNYTNASAIPKFTSEHGGMRAMGRSLARGNVLVLSLWNDATSNMLWLDGSLGNGTNPGDVRGPCGKRDESNDLKGASVTFSNFRVGDIGTTAAAAGKGPAAACILLVAIAASFQW